MFGEFQFGAGEFGETQVIPTPVPPPTPGTFQRVKVVCQRLDCAGATDTATYSLQDLIPSRIVAAAECVELDCTGTAPDVESYNLQDALYFNGTPVTVPVICPPGANCTPGQYPPITYPPGTFVLPDVPVTPGEPFMLQLQGCQSNVSVTLPANATAAQIAAAVDYIINQVALQQAQCDTFPNFPFSTVVALGGFVTSACIGSAFSTSITGASSPEDYPLSFAIVGGALPPGITLSSASATQAFFTGTPTTAGTYAFTLRATTVGGAVTTKGYTLAIGGITTASLADAVTGEPYSETMATAGLSGTLLWGLASGSLPAGLSLNSSTGEISGTPTDTEEANYNFWIFVQNSSQQCVKPFSISVGTCLITTASPLPEATLDEPYSTTLAAVDITGTLVWSIVSGSLPTGLTLNSATGEISGTPTVEETANFTARVTSGDNTCEKEFSLEVVEGSECPEWDTELNWTTVLTGGAGTTIPAAPGFAGGFETSQPGGVFDAAFLGGGFDYNGSGCNCNLHINLIKDPSNTNGGVIVVVNGAVVVLFQLSVETTGSYDFPFALPDTGGSPITITVQSSVQRTPAGPGASSIVGIFTNV